MNIECIKEKLSYAIGKAEKVTGKNITLPILNCVLLEAKDSTLTIKATNLDIGIEIKIPVKVIKSGVMAVSGGVLYNFISNITGDKNVTLEEVSGNLKVSTKHSYALIKSFAPDDFPTIPKISNESPFSFNIQSLIKGLKGVLHSASVSTLRPVLSAISLCSEEDIVVFAATDSFRLAEKKIGVKKHKEFNQILIPFKNAVEIIRILEDIKDDVEINLNQNQISFSYNDIYITSRVLDGVFPDYKQIIPKDVKTEVIVLKQDFINTLRVSTVFSDKFSQVTFNISPKEKVFKITTKNADIGENINNIDAVIKGEELSVSFNYKYIIDCFQSIDSDSISLTFSDANRPMIIRGVSDKSFLYLVMPMNK
ncbi:MAG: polymerase III subunit beta protein [Parcubacteria group bacterium GW2011_GWF2_39_8b]|uniref:Beta sliding clamp n=3 Tax=Candidatus Zambryskiibacteriota TaxID=1817925 RepID=A0A1G2T7S9_9BACT|nr:MAG: polymerase III subunit beta protein [Parcubacteria group bacterium GW2011_GWF2_39_8b]KKR45352.1 MAG: polymerase III subunit beta protein [Parcubacteria group bacterium GW2011_GWA2_40_14]OHA93310.1 MAG: DNA polymerase III subunit beta [Candidatus Zambryskibacteria bacterium RIFCSPHIGHO2_02_38_10.5]OHA97158.1 MAG: DNA polymerase III subunit beta [Candidatus Zambryskibacteria bacterium RIFCSPHIGHO2_02_FULL_39_82]OHA97436.1 MAG: DNA polymerase III subunit beta [Candidatus Zambryskibacteria 